MKEEMLLTLLCGFLDCTPGQIRSRSREKEIRQKRQIISYALKFGPKWTYKKISLVIKRHIDTVRHSIRTIESEIKTDSELDEIVGHCMFVISIASRPDYLRVKEDSTEQPNKPSIETSKSTTA